MASFVNPKEPGSYFCHTCFDFSLFYSFLIVLYAVILAGYIQLPLFCDTTGGRNLNPAQFQQISFLGFFGAELRKFTSYACLHQW